MAKAASKPKSMSIATIGFTRRYNIGNYEHEEYTAQAILEGIDAVEGFAQLKSMVTEAKATGEAEEETATPAPAKKASKKAPAPAPEVDEEDEDEDEETLEDSDEEEDEDDADEEGEESDDEDEDEEEAPAPAKKKAAKKAVEKAEPKKKNFRSKATVYSRNSDLHKKLYVEAVKEIMTEAWFKKNSGRAKAISIKLEGQDFLDSEGTVLDSFKAQIKKLSKAK